jgi:hypothetical protein
MLDRLELTPDNQFNGMSRDEFKQMLENMGFEVEDTNGKGYINFDDENNCCLTLICDKCGTVYHYIPKECKHCGNVFIDD